MRNESSLPTPIREARRETREPIGRRVARLRLEQGWTQQDLADRLAMSRTAVSHLEADMSQPSERTVLLLAGLFRIEPPAFVDGTLYPSTKGERLPLVAARYTELDLQLRVLEAEMAMISDLAPPARFELVDRWTKSLQVLFADATGDQDRNRVRIAMRELGDVFAR